MKFTKSLSSLLLACVIAVGCLPLFTACSSKYENKEVEAVISVAKAYLGRGESIQYEQNGLPGTNERRADNSHTRQPESYTVQNPAGSACSTFTYDAYMMALNFNIKYDNTASLETAPDEVKEFSYDITGDETPEEIAKIAKKYRKTLKKGDLIVYRRPTDTGHVMMYVGADEGLPEGQVIIHCSGSNYDKYEATGAIRTMSVDKMFDAENGANYYMFNGKIDWFGIVRPLNVYDKFDEPLPENTVNRINNLANVTASKLCSLGLGGTVSVGGEYSYYFTLKNDNLNPVTLSITDVVPANTTFVSATNGGVNDNGNISWSVEVPAGETKEVGYTLKVNNDATLLGTKISSHSAKIGGVSFDCQDVYVGNSLNATQMQTVKTNIQNVKATNLRGADALNYIYNGVITTTFEGTATDVYENVLEGDAFNSQGKYFNMIAPGLYDGTIYTLNSLYGGLRYKMVLPQSLMVGDLLTYNDFGVYENGKYVAKLFIYDGENLVDLSSNEVQSVDAFTTLQSVMVKNSAVKYVVLRPSLSLA